MTISFFPSPRALLRRCALCGIMATLAACTTTPRLDQQFGSRTRQDQDQQILHPEAGLNQTPVTGLDAPVATAVFDNYVRSYRTPEPHTSNLSGSGTSASH